MKRLLQALLPRSPRALALARAVLLAVPLGGCGLLRPHPPDYPVVTFPDGLVLRDRVVPGAGPAVGFGDTLALEYTIRLKDTGEVVDSSLERGSPFELRLVPGAVFPGLERGLLGMRVRGRRILRVPSSLGYGEAGLPPRIPPDADLIVNVEVVELEPGGPFGAASDAEEAPHAGDHGQQ